MAAKKETATVGDLWELPKGETMVTRPDGTTVTARGSHVLDVPGEYTSGDAKVTAKSK